jgi:hypothetical protein
MILFLMCLSHLFGDWMFQPRKMAVGKGLLTKAGWLWCLLHVSIYTTTFALITQNFDVWFLLSIFIPHFIIDKFSLLKYWMRLLDDEYWWEIYFKEPNTFENRLEMSFSGFKYAVIDNTIHLGCLYLSYIYFI